MINVPMSLFLKKFPDEKRVCCFVESEKDDLCEFLVSWGRSVGYEYVLSHEKSFANLLTQRCTPPTLVAVLGTNTNWTVLVDNDRIGNWPLSTLVCAGEHLKTNWFAIATSSDSLELRSVGFIHGGHKIDRREVRVVKDGKWSFSAAGSVRAFEDESAYEKRAIRERLTNSMVVHYAACLGIDLASNSDVVMRGESIFGRQLL